MSASSPFRGKWQCHDDPDDITWTMDGSLGPGTKLLLYKVGTLSTNDLVVAALQSDRAAPTRPAGLWDSYLYWVPYSGGAYKANGIASNGANADPKAARFAFTDGVPPLIKAYDGPPNSQFGLWAYITGGKFWGWTVASPKPTEYDYTMLLTAASAAHARKFLGGVCPPNADYTWVDLTDEDYTGISMTGAKFAGADLTRTDFRGSDLSAADFRNVYSVLGANMTGMTLAGAIFAGVDLTGMDFTGSNLTGADFRGVKSLLEVNFTNANLTSAHFEDLDLTGMKFTAATLPSVHFNGTILADTGFFDSNEHVTDLSGADFTVARTIRGARFATPLLSTNFAGVDLTGADFSGAEMIGTNFQGCDLRPATFSSPPTFSDDANYLTNLSHAIVDFSQLGKNWSFMNLVGTQIDGIPTDLSNLNAQSSLMMAWELSNHDLGGAILSNANLCGATLSSCNFTSAKMDGVQLQQYEATGRAAVLTGSQMEDADLSGANLTGATLSGVYLWGQNASISKATVQDTDFAQAYLTGMKFLSVANNQCAGVNFDYVCLINADFTGTKLTVSPNGEPVHMNKACLQGTNFTDAQLFGADLSTAAVDENPGKFLVTTQVGWPAGKTETIPLEYSTGTVGIETATDSTTICPAGTLGPCSGVALDSDQAPKTWPSHEPEPGRSEEESPTG